MRGVIGVSSEILKYLTGAGFDAQNNTGFQD